MGAGRQTGHPWVINLVVDPKERIPYDPRYQWVSDHFGKIMVEFQMSLKQEPLIPTGAPLNFLLKGESAQR